MGNCLYPAAEKNSDSRTQSQGDVASKLWLSSSFGTSFALSSLDMSLQSAASAEGIRDPSLRAFSYPDLKAATRNFRIDSMIGEGGFGRVFKGYIDETTFKPSRPGVGLLVAVKKLNVEGLQGHKEWLAELKFLGELHHPNLVKLIGFCAEAEHRLLVYEFLQRGSLDNHLFRKGSSSQALPWLTRMKVAVHAARGLAYLHTCQRPIIYRDFKSSNILLDSDFNVKLSDFGLAKDAPVGDKTHVTTRIMGTYGYAAPEYIATGKLTRKSDVYGYGVVLLELLTGRRAVDKTRPIEEQNLVEWAIPFLSDKRKVLRIMDQKLDGQYSLRGAKMAASLVLCCIHDDAKLRPSMNQVLEFMEPLLDPHRDASRGAATPPRTPIHNAMYSYS